jgi:hypothetical protein
LVVDVRKALPMAFRKRGRDLNSSWRPGDDLNDALLASLGGLDRARVVGVEAALREALDETIDESLWMMPPEEQGRSLLSACMLAIGAGAPRSGEVVVEPNDERSWRTRDRIVAGAKQLSGDLPSLVLLIKRVLPACSDESVLRTRDRRTVSSHVRTWLLYTVAAGTATEHDELLLADVAALVAADGGAFRSAREPAAGFSLGNLEMLFRPLLSMSATSVEAFEWWLLSSIVREVSSPDRPSDPEEWAVRVFACIPESLGASLSGELPAPVRPPEQTPERRVWREEFALASRAWAASADVLMGGLVPRLHNELEHYASRTTGQVRSCWAWCVHSLRWGPPLRQTIDQSTLELLAPLVQEWEAGAR